MERDGKREKVGRGYYAVNLNYHYKGFLPNFNTNRTYVKLNLNFISSAEKKIFHIYWTALNKKFKQRLFFTF